MIHFRVYYISDQVFMNRFRVYYISDQVFMNHFCVYYISDQVFLNYFWVHVYLRINMCVCLCKHVCMCVWK